MRLILTLALLLIAVPATAQVPGAIGGATLKGGSVSGVLIGEAGSSAMSLYAGGACDPGEFITGLDAEGVPACALPGSGSAPTGTGWRHVTDGVEDGTASTPTAAEVGAVPTARSVSTTAPLTGGGDLTTDRTLGVAAATTEAVGVVELATDGENAANVAVQGNDGRLSNARTPTAHATSHQPGGGDAMAVDAAAATGSLRTLGTGAQQAAAGNDGRLSDARTPTAHATSHKSAGGDAIKLDELAAPTDVTTLNATTSAHGLLPKLSGNASDVFKGDGTWGAGGEGSGAPTEATYWTGSSNATLSAEHNLGALGTGLVINTSGTPSAYAGTSCTNQFPRSLNASGTATCADVAAADFGSQSQNAVLAGPTSGAGDPTFRALVDGDVPNTITLDNLTQITTRAIADTTGTLAVARGGTNLTASADDNVMVGNGTTWETKALPSCSDPTTSKMLYNSSTNAWSCGTDQTGGGGGTTTLTATGDVSDAVIAGLTTITGLSFTPAANTKYLIDCYIIYTSTATTTGITFAWDTPASPTRILMVGHAATAAAGAANSFHQRADATIAGTSTATPAVGPAEFLAKLSTLFENGANATTMSLGMSPETANSVTVKTGSVCQYRTYS